MSPAPTAPARDLDDYLRNAEVVPPLEGERMVRVYTRDVDEGDYVFVQYLALTDAGRVLYWNTMLTSEKSRFPPSGYVALSGDWEAYDLADLLATEAARIRPFVDLTLAR